LRVLVAQALVLGKDRAQVSIIGHMIGFYRLRMAVG
jgi:hypothetical protein